MASLFENITIPPCIWFEGDKRNALVAILSGFLVYILMIHVPNVYLLTLIFFQFSVGWWILIDAASVYPHEIVAGYHMCGVVGTLSLLMVNSVSNAQVGTCTA